MRTVCGQFCGIFGGFSAVVGPLLHECCLSQVVPLCLVPEIALPRACRADDFGWFGHGVHFFGIFPAFFVFFQRRFEHGRFSCKGGRDMAGKIPTTFATSCNRPSALWASQPSLLSCSLLPPFSSASPPFSLFFSNVFSFLPFSLFPSLFFTFFPQFSSNFPSPPLTSRFFQRFFGQSDTSPCDPFVSNVPHEAPPTHRTRHVVKEDFCIFFGIFGHLQINRILFGETPKKEGFRVHVIWTLSFFL